MKPGDLVKWNFFGQYQNVGNEPIGFIVSDYWQKQDGVVYKNVYWIEQQWVRPIDPIHLEVISESR